MRQNNICKFVPTHAAIALNVHNFVHETDREIMNTPQQLPHNLAVLVCDGVGKIKSGAHSVQISRGTLLFAFAGEMFMAEGDALQYMYIGFSGERANELFNRYRITPATRSFSGFDSIVPLWQESLTRASEENVDLLAESMLLYTFSRLSAGIAKTNDIVNKMLKLLENYFTEPDISINAIADELGYNAKYLSHLFKDKLGIGYSEHLRNLRIQYAITLFDHGIDSVKNVALLSGFQDPLYFSSVFKKSVGVSPTQYIDSKNKHDINS